MSHTAFGLQQSELFLHPYLEPVTIHPFVDTVYKLGSKHCVAPEGITWHVSPEQQLGVFK